MVRSMKRGVKKVRNYRFTKNTEKNKWKHVKRNRKRGPKEETLNLNWEGKKSTKQNMERMGLVYDLNKDIPSSSKAEPMKVDTKKQVLPVDSTVIKNLEAEAKKPTPKTLRLSQPEIRYCIYMIEKHGENYEAMAKDAKNIYQDTAAQLKRKIDTFKGIPVQYNAYLRSKGLLPNGSAKQESMDTS